MSYEVKDSGERQEFDSGMVRDTTKGKTNWSLVADGPMLGRYAEHLTKGAVKYDARNWMQAEGQAEADRFRESAFRHFMQWYLGDTDEDHAAAVWFNINGAEYVKAQAEQPASTDHRTYYDLAQEWLDDPTFETPAVVDYEKDVTINESLGFDTPKTDMPDAFGFGEFPRNWENPEVPEVKRWTDDVECRGSCCPGARSDDKEVVFDPCPHGYSLDEICSICDQFAVGGVI